MATSTHTTRDPASGKTPLSSPRSPQRGSEGERTDAAKKGQNADGLSSLTPLQARLNRSPAIQRLKTLQTAANRQGSPKVVQRHHNYGKTKLSNGDVDVAEIYAVYEKSSGSVVYVGQTCQGQGHAERFKQHCGSKLHPHWSSKTHRVKLLETDSWTLLETFVAEQYWIDKNGGAASLENGQAALRLATWKAYRDDAVTTPKLKGDYHPLT